MKIRMSESHSIKTLEELRISAEKEVREIFRGHMFEATLNKQERYLLQKKKERLLSALRLCGTGDEDAKGFVKSVLQDVLTERLRINEEVIEELIPFSKPKRLNVIFKFFVVLKQYEKQYRQDAFGAMCDRHGWFEKNNILTEEDIQRMYESEKTNLTDLEKLEFLTQRLYEMLYGLGHVDALIGQKIDGISAGTSRGGEYENSVWLQWKGRNVHLAFLGLGGEKELIRICKRIYRYGAIGQLSASKGYVVNELADGSRVVVTRPPFSESWSFFVRQFHTTKRKELEALLTDSNACLPIQLLMWLMKSYTTIAITGEQGSGKTTLLTALIEYIPRELTLRIQEMNFELHLRKHYPDRNIVTFCETGTVTMQEGLDLQKKTDGSVNILGEVATHEAGSYMIQMGITASLFTLFTHHAKSTEDLLHALRNSLIICGQFNREDLALAQVVNVVRFDIHLKKEKDGHRYIERITEIEEDTGQEDGYRLRTILYWNAEHASYEAGEGISKKQLHDMKQHLSREEWKEWVTWYQSSGFS